MPARPPELPVENPSALIRSRIRERRIFEARFLCRQLGAAIEAQEKHQLERELTDVLAQVNTLRQLAGQHIAEGRNDLAAQLYRDIEQLAIDVPGLAEEQRTLAGAEAIFAKITGKGPEGRETAPQAPASAPPVAPTEPASETIRIPIALKKPSLVSEAWRNLQHIPLRWRLAIGIGCLTILLLFVLRNPQNRQAPPTTAPYSNTTPKQTISIRPLEAAPAPSPGQPDRKTDSEPSTAEPSTAEPAPGLKIEALQIQKSLRE